MAAERRTSVSLHSSSRPRRLWEHGDWTESAVCRSVDLELFFPVKGGTALPAKTVCRNCPAIADCLLDALGAPWVEGVWGGTSHRDRIRLRRELPLDYWTERELRAFAARFADQVRAMDTDPEPKDQT